MKYREEYLLGVRLKRERKRLGLTYRALGELLGMHWAHIHKIETSDRGVRYYTGKRIEAWLDESEKEKK